MIDFPVMSIYYSIESRKMIDFPVMSIYYSIESRKMIDFPVMSIYYSIESRKMIDFPVMSIYYSIESRKMIDFPVMSIYYFPVIFSSHSIVVLKACFRYDLHPLLHFPPLDFRRYMAGKRFTKKSHGKRPHMKKRN